MSGDTSSSSSGANLSNETKLLERIAHEHGDLPKAYFGWDNLQDLADWNAVTEDFNQLHENTNYPVVDIQEIGVSLKSLMSSLYLPRDDSNRIRGMARGRMQRNCFNALVWTATIALLFIILKWANSCKGVMKVVHRAIFGTQKKRASQEPPQHSDVELKTVSSLKPLKPKGGRDADRDETDNPVSPMRTSRDSAFSPYVRSSMFLPIGDGTAVLGKLTGVISKPPPNTPVHDITQLANGEESLHRDVTASEDKFLSVRRKSGDSHSSGIGTYIGSANLNDIESANESARSFYDGDDDESDGDDDESNGRYDGHDKDDDRRSKFFLPLTAPGSEPPNYIPDGNNYEYKLRKYFEGMPLPIPQIDRMDSQTLSESLYDALSTLYVTDFSDSGELTDDSFDGGVNDDNENDSGSDMLYVDEKVEKQTDLNK